MLCWKFLLLRDVKLFHVRSKPQWRYIWWSWSNSATWRQKGERPTKAGQEGESGGEGKQGGSGRARGSIAQDTESPCDTWAPIKHHRQYQLLFSALTCGDCMYQSSSLETSEDSFTFDSGLCTAWRRAGDYYEARGSLSFRRAKSGRDGDRGRGQEWRHQGKRRIGDF